MPTGLELCLLYRVMERLGELSNRSNNLMTTSDLVDLVPARVDQDGEQMARNFVNRHLEHLAGRGYVTLGHSTMEGFRVVQLTAEGEMFIQPELAEFGQIPMLPKVVESLEKQIATLTYPQEEKNGMLFRLREAIAKQVPEMIAKVIVEIATRIVTGTP